MKKLDVDEVIKHANEMYALLDEREILHSLLENYPGGDRYSRFKTKKILERIDVIDDLMIQYDFLSEDGLYLALENHFYDVVGNTDVKIYYCNTAVSTLSHEDEIYDYVPMNSPNANYFIFDDLLSLYDCVTVSATDLSKFERDHYVIYDTSMEVDSIDDLDYQYRRWQLEDDYDFGYRQLRAEFFKCLVNTGNEEAAMREFCNLYFNNNKTKKRIISDWK